MQGVAYLIDVALVWKSHFHLTQTRFSCGDSAILSKIDLAMTGNTSRLASVSLMYLFTSVPLGLSTCTTMLFIAPLMASLNLSYSLAGVSLAVRPVGRWGAGRQFCSEGICATRCNARIFCAALGIGSSRVPVMSFLMLRR